MPETQMHTAGIPQGRKIAAPGKWSSGDARTLSIQLVSIRDSWLQEIGSDDDAQR